MRRYEVADRQWAMVAPLLSGKVTAQDNRVFSMGLSGSCTGGPWADLPARFGKSNSVCRCFRRLAQKGVWEKLFETLKVPDFGLGQTIS